MRLTLRTMLAFLDGILEKSDTDTLNKKIQESEYASNLVQRLRDVTRKTRLAAPKVDGRGLGLDPNSVSEYLDNTMPPDRVPEFERVCLDSDVHLAEVASCHHILTMVLGEPAEFDPALRERMYALTAPPERPLPTATEPKSPTDSGKIEPAPAKSKATGPRKKPPAEMVEANRSKSWFSLVPTIGLAFVVTIVALLAMGKFDRNHPVYRLMFAGKGMGDSGSDVAIDPHIRDATDSDSTNRTNQFKQPGPSDSSTEAPAVPAINDVAPNDIKPHDTTPNDTTPNDSEPNDSEPNDSEPNDSEPNDSEPNDSAPNERQPSGRKRGDERPLNDRSVGGKSDDNQSADTETKSTRSSVSIPPSIEPDIDLSNRKSKERPGDNVVIDPTRPPNFPERVASVQPPVATSIDSNAIVGRCISDAQILSVWESKTEAWMRLATDAPLRPGDQLLAFPVYRPQILLATGFKVTFAGPSHCIVGPLDADGWPGLSSSYGRMSVVNTEGKSGAKLHFDFGGRQVTVRFLDAETALAIEHIRYLAPGNDPLLKAPQNVVAASVIKGKVEWLEGERTDTVSSGQARLCVESDAGNTEKLPVPAWLNSRSTSTLNANASRDLEALVQTDRPIALSLMEAVERRRQVEVLSLAIRCLVHMDEYGPLISALSNDAQHSYWSAMVEALQFAVTRSSDSASKFMTALEKVRPHDASQLYRMSWGYSPEQLAAGSAAELVAALEHKSTDIRVLALENLHKITGMTKFFRPEKPPEQQKLHLRNWNKALAEGKVIYEVPPSLQSTFQPAR